MDKKTANKPLGSGTLEEILMADKKTCGRKQERKGEPSEKVTLQFGGKDYPTDALLQSARDIWQYDLRKSPEEIRTVELYVKPEENRAYYVINGDTSGKFSL